MSFSTKEFDSPIGDIDGRAKVIAAVVLVIAIVMNAPLKPMEFFGVVLVLLAAALLGRVRILGLLARSLVVIPFAGAMVLFAPLKLVESWTLSGVGIALSRGWPLMVDMIGVAWLGVLCMMTLVSVSSSSEIYAALGRLRVPAVFVMLISFIERYLELFRDQIMTMQRAIVARAPRMSRRRMVGVYGGLAGNLIVRASEKGERVFAAMEARGYTGTMPMLVPPKFGASEILACCVPHFLSSPLWRSIKGEPMLVFDNVVYDYPDGTHALDGLSFAIEAGERVALLGPNGAGKSTLMLHTNGILLPRSGSVRVGGMLVDKAHLVEVREAVGLVFQDPEDQLFMPSVHEDIGFGPLNMGLNPEEVHRRIHAALDAVDLEDIRLKAGAHISFGQKKRIALATVLACENKVLVLDEPTSNLDPRSRRQMIELLDRLDATLLVATHDIDFAWDVCPRSLIINKGRVVADGSTRELLRNEALLYENGLEPPGAVKYGMSRS